MRHNYGFYLYDAKRSGPAASTVLVPGSDRIYAVTGDFCDLARNHCCATTVTNFSLYYGITLSSTRDLFKRIHHFIGNGPIFRPAKNVRRYFDSMNISIDCRQVWRSSPLGSYENLCEIAKYEIREGRPIGILLSADPFAWHWVFCVGYEQMPDGEVRFLICDNWHPKGLRVFVPDHPSKFHAVFTLAVLKKE